MPVCYNESIRYSRPGCYSARFDIVDRFATVLGSTYLFDAPHFRKWLTLTNKTKNYTEPSSRHLVSSPRRKYRPGA